MSDLERFCLTHPFEVRCYERKNRIALLESLFIVGCVVIAIISAFVN